MRTRPFTLARAWLLMAVLVAPATARAASFTFNSTIDVSSCDFRIECNFFVSLLDPNTGYPEIGTGDAVTITVDFLGSQLLVVEDIDSPLDAEQEAFIALAHTGVDGGYASSNVNVALTDLSGTLLEPLSAVDIGLQSNIGAFFFGDFVAPGSSVSFSGLQTSFTVGLIQGPEDPAIFDSLAFSFRADRLTVGTAPAPVPEPSTLPLLGLGLGAAVVRGRTKRR